MPSEQKGEKRDLTHMREDEEDWKRTKARRNFARRKFAEAVYQELVTQQENKIYHFF